jgi:hypothetical protein
MEFLDVRLENCYGIKSLNHVFDFRDRRKHKAYAIYAPNGLMKTSFSKTFDALANGNDPLEERFNRQPVWKISADGASILARSIYVVKSEIDIQSESSAITNLLVDPTSKVRYDALLLGLNERRESLTRSLQKASKVKAKDIETTVLRDWGMEDLPSCIEKMLAEEVTSDLSEYKYETIFNSKALDVLDSVEFQSKAAEFSSRYNSLFEQDGTIFKKGVFNPPKADASFDSLKKHGFFAGGHKVHLEGYDHSIDEEGFSAKLEAINRQIDEDAELKKLRANLTKNAEAAALVNLIETLPTSKVDYLLESVRPDNRNTFRKKLWAYYAQGSSESQAYLDAHAENKDEIEHIEKQAASEIPHWKEAVDLFNARFMDMPFTLVIADQSQVVLGKKRAELRFVFEEDGESSVEWSRSEVKTLSQGEKRALFLLNFIFEVEARRRDKQETLFIIDDIADSFDYKNKHAIVQYLADLTKVECFHQIVLTHNFDFFRTLTGFVSRDRSLMANSLQNGVELTVAEGVSNPFIKIWKKRVAEDDCVLCATIPFTRNLIEYTRGEDDADYMALTSMLHWKRDSHKLTVGMYMEIYNRLFGTSHATARIDLIHHVLFRKADEICRSQVEEGIDLSKKVLLSIAIRMKAEIFMLREIRYISGRPRFWYEGTTQFGNLIKLYSKYFPSKTALTVLERVSVTVSSNIHLNSFMYEPILDLTMGHLVELYGEVRKL